MPDDKPKVVVPTVIGMTQLAAETALRSAGLVVGKVTTTRSHLVPADGVNSVEPAVGTTVDSGSTVDLVLSLGPRNFWQTFLTNLPTILYSVLGIAILAVIGYVLLQRTGDFLIRLADKEIARGLITFLIALTTVGIAVILAISTILSTASPDDDKRFDRGKQVLTLLIGVLGTIVGFYFGSAQETKGAHQPLAITTTSLPAGTVNTAYPSTVLQTIGGTPPLKWSVTPLPAGLSFDTTTGTISGTPTIATQTKSTFAVTDSGTPAASSHADLTIEIK